MYTDWAKIFGVLWLRRRNRRQRRTGQAIPDKLGKESRERPDVFLDARFFERGHVRLAFRERNHRPGIACRRHHRVHEKPSHAPVAVHVRVDIDEDKMPERRPDSRMFLCAQQIEEGWHGIPYRLLVQRNVHRVADKNLAIAITGKVRRPQQARRHARREHLSIPSPVILLGDGSRVFSLEYLAYALLDELEGLPIPARGHGVALLAVLLDRKSTRLN